MSKIFEFMDYREFLRIFFEEKKKDLPFYSYRLFSQKAGFKSPNFLKLVMNGERNLSKESVFKFIKAIGLNKKESDYFENLVFLNQSGTLEEKNLYLSKLMKHRVKTDPKKIEESEYEFYSQWYNPVIRELATCIDFKGDFKKLGACVVPSISPLEAERSLKLLLKLDFLRMHTDGTYCKTSASLTTGPQVRSVAIGNFHKSMIQLASDSIDRFPSMERDITSVTLSVSDETYNVIKSKLQQLRKDLMELAEADKNTQRIVQLNLQLFPLSNALEAGEGKV